MPKISELLRDKASHYSDDVVNSSPGFFVSKPFKRVVCYAAGTLAGLFLTSPLSAGINKTLIKDTNQAYTVSTTQNSMNLEEILNAEINPPYPDETYNKENLYLSEITSMPIEEKIEIMLQVHNPLYVISENGEKEIKKMDVAPFIKDSRTMVPLRFVAEGLGASIEWDDVERKVTIKYKNKIINFFIDKSFYTITKNWTTETKYLDANLEIKDGRTFISVRAAAEAMGATLAWNPDTFGIIITQVDKTYLNLGSDIDMDGVPLWKERSLRSNPHSKFSLSYMIADGEICEWAEQYGVDIRHYTSENGLGIIANTYFGFNPYEKSHFDSELSDKEVLEYALEHGITEIDNKDLSPINNLLNQG